MTGLTTLRSLPCRPNGNLAIDRRTGEACLTLTNTGGTEMAFAVHPAAAQATPVWVGPLRCGRYRPGPVPPGGEYELSVHGPDGFLRSFAGAVVPLEERDTPAPAVRGELAGNVLRLFLSNEGRCGVPLTVTDNRTGAVDVRYLPGGGLDQVSCPTDHGRYDVTVQAGDGRLRYRFAG